MLGKVVSGQADAGLVYVTDANSAGRRSAPCRSEPATPEQLPDPPRSGSRPGGRQMFVDLVTGPDGNGPSPRPASSRESRPRRQIPVGLPGWIYLACFGRRGARRRAIGRVTAADRLAALHPADLLGIVPHRLAFEPEDCHRKHCPVRAARRADGYRAGPRQFPGLSVLRALVCFPSCYHRWSAVSAALTFGRQGLLGQHLEAFGIRIAFTTAAVVLAEFRSLPFLVVSLEGPTLGRRPVGEHRRDARWPPDHGAAHRHAATGPAGLISGGAGLRAIPRRVRRDLTFAGSCRASPARFRWRSIFSVRPIRTPPSRCHCC